MRALIASALLATPLLMAAQPAQAQSYNYVYGNYGNYVQGSVYGPSGYSGNLTQSRIGNFITTTYADNYGSTSCQTSVIGIFVTTSCY